MVVQALQPVGRTVRVVRREPGHASRVEEDVDAGDARGSEVGSVTVAAVHRDLRVVRAVYHSVPERDLDEAQLRHRVRPRPRQPFCPVSQPRRGRWGREVPVVGPRRSAEVGAAADPEAFRAPVDEEVRRRGLLRGHVAPREEAGPDGPTVHGGPERGPDGPARQARPAVPLVAGLSKVPRRRPQGAVPAPVSLRSAPAPRRRGPARGTLSQKPAGPPPVEPGAAVLGRGVAVVARVAVVGLGAPPPPRGVGGRVRGRRHGHAAAAKFGSGPWAQGRRSARAVKHPRPRSPRSRGSAGAPRRPETGREAGRDP